MVQGHYMKSPEHFLYEKEMLKNSGTMSKGHGLKTKGLILADSVII